MIVSASYRTDIPAFYADWFQNRLAAGHCIVPNPYGGPPGRVALSPDAVDGFVFWTRNLGPFLPALDAVATRGLPFVVQMTITGYPRALDAATIAPDAAVAQLARTRDRFGPRVAVWRYDPIVITSLTPPAWHRRVFAGLATALRGVVDEVVVSFAHFYRKTRRNLAAAAERRGFAWEDPDDATKRALLGELSALAADAGIRLAMCGQREDAPGVAAARCIDPGRLSDVAGRPIVAPAKPHRRCGCAASRDIGAYDGCPHGCVYCYAVASRALAKRRYAAHDAAADSLAPDSRREVPAA